MEPTFFETPEAFRNWLEKNHARERELLVGYWKVGTRKPSITWPESVDEALCFGWIDGIRRSIDADSYSVRFTPRKPTSIWSAVNIRKVGELVAAGKMTSAGQAAFEKRRAAKSEIYSYEKAPSELSADYEARFKANEKAWQQFMSMPASYRRTAIHWVTAAKQQKTRDARMETLIADSTEGLRIKPLRR